jgi:fumarate reductase subunit D
VSLIGKLEALFWMLFGAGGFLAALFLPGLILGVLLIGGNGGFEAGLAYDRVRLLVGSGLGRVLVGGFLVLVIWHCAHHLRHLALDIGGHGVAAPAAFLCYAGAIAGTVLAIRAVALL